MRFLSSLVIFPEGSTQKKVVYFRFKYNFLYILQSSFKIYPLKRREGGLLVVLLGYNFQVATVCIPDYAFLDRLFWLTAYLTKAGLHFLFLAASKLRFRCFFFCCLFFCCLFWFFGFFCDWGIYMCTNSPCINIPTDCICCSKNSWDQDRSYLKMVLWFLKNVSVLVESF